MKKSFVKTILCLILALTLCTYSCATALCTTSNNKAFDDIDSFRAYVTEIYNNNYDELIKIAKTLDNITVPDKYITYDSNCGPCSVAFQNILYKHNILVEVTEKTLVRTHAFNLYRASFIESSQEISLIVVDTTYKQFIVDKYKSEGLSIEDMAQDIPQVLVYEYNDFDAMEKQLKNMKNSLPQDKYESALKEVFDNNTKFEYMSQDFQDVPHKELTTYDSRLLDDLRNKSGQTNKKLNKNATLFSTTTDYKAKFYYDCNGIYRCYVPYEDVEKISSGFVIADENRNILFGCETENDTLSIASTNSMTNHDNDLKILKSNGAYPISLNTQGLFLPILISIDLRAGEERAAIYAHPIGQILKYGDVDIDGDISVKDVTFLQKAIAKHQGYTLDVYQNETSNVTKKNPLCILNATVISRYLAKYDTEKCGQQMYFSSAFRVGHVENLGYIDMPEALA